MMKSFLIPALLAGALGAPLAVAPASLAPNQKWVVEFAENQCVASRSYGSAEKPLIVALKPSPMGKILQLSFVGAGGGSTDQIRTRVQIGADPVIETSALAFNASDGERHVVRINLPEEQLDRLALASSLSVKVGSRLNETLTLSSMPGLVKAMKECMTDLKGHWNVGPAAEGRLKERATGELAKWFTPDDYPDLATRAGDVGTVQFVVLVDQAGKVSDCTVTETSNAPVLDAQACALLSRRARLKPAIGLDGKPARDALTGRVKWQLR
jgi:TonB family protein